MTDTLHVPHPERWWFAARDDLPWLTDPDGEDGKVRHPDRDQRQWAAIAGIVETVARALTSGSYAIDVEDPAVSLVPVDLAGLEVADRNIVTTWFRVGSEAPSGDVWMDSLGNGRHRLWGAWQAAPGALLPIHSELLPYADDVPYMDAEFARVFVRSAADGLRKMLPGPAIRSSRYIDELRRVAREGGHYVDGLA